MQLSFCTMCLIVHRCSVQQVSLKGLNWHACLNKNWATRALHLKYKSYYSHLFPPPLSNGLLLLQKLLGDLLLRLLLLQLLEFLGRKLFDKRVPALIVQGSHFEGKVLSASWKIKYIRGEYDKFMASGGEQIARMFLL